MNDFLDDKLSHMFRDLPASQLLDPTILHFGLPQGSVVGPVAYNVTTLPVGDIANHQNYRTTLIIIRITKNR